MSCRRRLAPVALATLLLAMAAGPLQAQLAGPDRPAPSGTASFLVDPAHSLPAPVDAQVGDDFSGVAVVVALLLGICPAGAGFTPRRRSHAARPAASRSAARRRAPPLLQPA